MSELAETYFNWLCSNVTNDPRSSQDSYSKLLRRLFEKKFNVILIADRDRASDGVQLRSFYISHVLALQDVNALKEELGPCRILEMMVAIARRCESSTMHNEKVGDRTGQWFWEMIGSLGLGQMTDPRFDELYVDIVLEIFMDRRYKPNGEGGLFTVWNTEDDMRKISIWKQLNLYLTELLMDEGIIKRRI